ncbi:MAG TPA: twin-arginine translocase TatA/TatE family subunit [Nitrososphaera sp.]|nr:twin-arginine translocase TatA/TatE family subunit [Nitrososphaera sp.]
MYVIEMLHSAILTIAGTEWIIIVLLALVLLFGSKKLPQLSRTIGRAVGEFEKAKSTFRKEMEEASEEARAATSKIPKITGPVSTEREKLETLADTLGISERAHMSDDELRALISRRLAS